MAYTSEFVQQIENYLEDGVEVKSVIIIVLILILIIFAVGIIFCFYIGFKKTLQLRKYGETWVRHTITKANYEREVLSYICNLYEYEGKTEKEQKKLFMQNILAIFQKNIDKFEENMKSIKEATE